MLLNTSKLSLYLLGSFFLLNLSYTSNASNDNLNKVTFDHNDVESFSHIWSETDIEVIKQIFPFFSKNCSSYEALNFGVVIDNGEFLIYRSQGLGVYGVETLFNHLEEANLDRPNTVIFMNRGGYKDRLGASFLSPENQLYKNLRSFAFEQAVLFGKKGKYSDIKFYHPLNKGVYVSGEDPLSDVNTYNIGEYTDKKIRKRLQKSMDRNGISKIIGVRSNFFRVLQLILENNGPILFHCTGGLHRTGMIALSLRYMQGGVWTYPFESPIIVSVGLGIKREVALHNLAEIEYYLHNPIQLREKNLRSMRKVSGTEEFYRLRSSHFDKLSVPSTYSPTN